jgi:hypothetical protein
MSVVNGLYYQVLRSSIGFTVTGTSVYATIPWYPQSTIDELKITNVSGTAFTVSAFSILNTGAHYRNSTTDGKSHVIYRDGTDVNATAAESYFARWGFNPPVFHENLYDRPFLNIAVTFTESKTNIPLRITAVGKKALATTSARTETNAVEITNDYRVLVGRGQSGSAGTGGTIFDVTRVAIGNGGENAPEFKFALVNDYIYVGSKKKIDHWEFQVGLGSSAPSTLTGEIWSGSAWSAFTVIDDTSTGNSDTMKFSGILEGSGLGSSAWSPVVFRPSDNILLPNDPLTAQQDRIIAGGYPIVVLPENSPRYWARFKMNTVPAGSEVILSKILPVSEAYEAF